jgi:hypothetical protein
LPIYKLFYNCDNSGPNLCRAVRAMNEKLKQNRLLKEQGDGSSLSQSPSDRISSAELQKNVCVVCISLITNKYAIVQTAFL